MGCKLEKKEIQCVESALDISHTRVMDEQRKTKGKEKEINNFPFSQKSTGFIYRNCQIVKIWDY